jgi:hypothetical protein
LARSGNERSVARLFSLLCPGDEFLLALHALAEIVPRHHLAVAAMAESSSVMRAGAFSSELPIAKAPPPR